MLPTGGEQIARADPRVSPQRPERVRPQVAPAYPINCLRSGVLFEALRGFRVATASVPLRFARNGRAKS